MNGLTIMIGQLVFGKLTNMITGKKDVNKLINRHLLIFY